MSGLSDEDRAALNDAEAAWILWRERGSWESYMVPAVEAIVQRAVNEALTEAADEIEASWDPGDSIGGRFVGPTVNAALEHAARIVRDHRTRTTA